MDIVPRWPPAPSMPLNFCRQIQPKVKLFFFPLGKALTFLNPVGARSTSLREESGFQC